MAVRVRVRVAPAGRSAAPALETVAVANCGFEARTPEALLPVRLAQWLGLWPPPASARTERFDSPAGSLAMVSLPRALRVSVVGSNRAVTAGAVVSERETEMVLSDWLVDGLRIELVAPGRGLYRIGPRGRRQRSAKPEIW